PGAVRGRAARAARPRAARHCLLGAIVVVLGGRLVQPHGLLAVAFFLLRWVVTVALLLATIATLIRFVPAKRRPARWIRVGSISSAGAWIVTTLAFAAYVSTVPYSSYYGAFASI